MKGKIEVVKGMVYVYRQGRTLQAVDDMNLYTGDLIETAQGGAVMLQLMDLGLLKLKPSTQIIFPPEDKEQIQASRVQIPFGEAWFKVRSLNSGEKFYVHTPHSATQLNGSIATVSHDVRRKKSSISLIEGTAEVFKEQNHYFLETGERLVLDVRPNSRERRTRLDIFSLNQEWKEVITIREKVERRLKQEEMGVVGEDLESPIVHIVQPRAGIPMKKSRVEFKATIHEPNLDRIILTHNGKTIKDVQTSLKQFQSDLVLVPGQNLLEIKAIDRFGNVGVARENIKLSELPPSISVFFPMDNAELSSRFVDLQGVVDDPDVREVVVYLNDRRIARERATPTFLVPLILDIGHNRLRVEAKNQVGLSGSTEIEVYTDTTANLIINFDQILNQ